MHQPTFARAEFEQDGYTTRRQKFLERLDGLVPWERFEAAIAPHYPKPGRGRRPYPLSVMLRIHIVQLCYNLSDPGTEDLLHEAESVRAFCHLTCAGRSPTRRPSSHSVTWSSATPWGAGSSSSSTSTLRARE